MNSLLSDDILLPIIKGALDMSPDVIGIFDEKRALVFCNSAYTSLYGISEKEALGCSSKDLLKYAWKNKQGVIIDTDDFESWHENLQKLHDEKSINQFETDLNDGRWLRMTRIILKSGFLMLHGVDITDLKKLQLSLEAANEQITILANTDQLTRVHNRRAFNEIATSEIERARRYQQPLSLVVMDIDHFKNINDNYGHEGGDVVLQAFADQCKQLLRQSDALCRIGGEEFVILLPMTDLGGARRIAERVRTQIGEYRFSIQQLDRFIDVTVSLGITEFKPTDTSIKEALNRADTALYSAKCNGRNQVVEVV